MPKPNISDDLNPKKNAVVDSVANAAKANSSYKENRDMTGAAAFVKNTFKNKKIKDWPEMDEFLEALQGEIATRTNQMWEEEE